MIMIPKVYEGYEVNQTQKLIDKTVNLKSFQAVFTDVPRAKDDSNVTDRQETMSRKDYDLLQSRNIFALYPDDLNKDYSVQDINVSDEE